MPDFVVLYHNLSSHVFSRLRSPGLHKSLLAGRLLQTFDPLSSPSSCCPITFWIPGFKEVSFGAQVSAVAWQACLPHSPCSLQMLLFLGTGCASSCDPVCLSNWQCIPCITSSESVLGFFLIQGSFSSGKIEVSFGCFYEYWVSLLAANPSSQHEISLVFLQRPHGVQGTVGESLALCET